MPHFLKKKKKTQKFQKQTKKKTPIPVLLI